MQMPHAGTNRRLGNVDLGPIVQLVELDCGLTETKMDFDCRALLAGGRGLNTRVTEKPARRAGCFNSEEQGTHRSCFALYRTLECYSLTTWMEN